MSKVESALKKVGAYFQRVFVLLSRKLWNKFEKFATNLKLFKKIVEKKLKSDLSDKDCELFRKVCNKFGKFLFDVEKTLK